MMSKFLEKVGVTADNTDSRRIPMSLQDAEDCALIEHEYTTSSKGGGYRSRWRGQLGSVLMHVGIFCVYATLYTLLARSWPFLHGHRPHLVYSPMNEAVEWTKTRFASIDVGKNNINKYRGDPSPESDAAWDELLSVYNVRIDEETLVKVGGHLGTAVDINDAEGGYIAVPDALHMLHCLRMIRIAFTPDLYPWFQPYVTSRYGELIPQHLDHCIDALRESVMCNADVTLVTSDWIDAYPEPWGNFDVVHECVNWDKIIDWVKAHHVDIRDKLVHPKYGPIHWQAPLDLAFNTSSTENAETN